MLHLFHFIKSHKKNKHERVLRFSFFFFLWAIAFAIFEYFAPLYLETLHLSFFEMGIILSGSSFISLFIDPFLGYVQKKFPPKTLLLTSIILFLFTILLFTQSPNVFLLLFLATNIYGIAFDLFSITSYKNIFDNSIETNRSTNISFFESLYFLGLLLGALLAGFVIATDIKFAVYLCIAFLLLLFCVIFFSEKTPKIQSGESWVFLKGYKELWREISHVGWSGLFLIFLLIFVHLFDGFFFVFEPLFAQKFQGYAMNSYALGGILLAIYTLPMVLLERRFGKLEDLLGRKEFILIGFFISFLSLGILQISDLFIVTAFCLFFVSLGFSAIALPAIESLYQSLVEKKFGKSANAYSASIMETTLSLGFLLGPLLGGFFLSLDGGFRLAFQSFAIVTLILFFCSFFFLKEPLKKKNHIVER